MSYGIMYPFVKRHTVIIENTIQVIFISNMRMC